MAYTILRYIIYRIEKRDDSKRDIQNDKTTKSCICLKSHKEDK